MWHCPAIFCKVGKRVLELQMYLHGRATTFTNPFVLVGLSQNRGFHGLPYILPLSGWPGKGGSYVSQNGFSNIVRKIDFYHLNEVFET